MADNIYATTLESLGLMIAFEETLDLVKVDPAPDLTPAALTAEDGSGGFARGGREFEGRLAHRHT